MGALPRPASLLGGLGATESKLIYLSLHDWVAAAGVWMSVATVATEPSTIVGEMLAAALRERERGGE